MSDEEFSDDGLDEFEESLDEKQLQQQGNNSKKETSLQNKPWDEAYEVSQDLSVAESFDGRKNAPTNNTTKKETKLTNDKYDEAFEVSQSMDNMNKPQSTAAQSKGNMNLIINKPSDKKSSSNDSPHMNPQLSKSNSIPNKPFDEALEFSQSDSGESLDTQGEREKRGNKHGNAPAPLQSKPPGQPQGNQAQKPAALQQKPSANPAPTGVAKPNSQHNSQQALHIKTDQKHESSEEEEEEDDEDGDQDHEHDDSYEHIEGAYNSRDYVNLNVSQEVRDLFQYIDRYKPHEVELDTPLKCFIPEYIPSIGEMDSFIKIPRPDGQPDHLGLKLLDEPALIQSDPTVLELQLRAMSKKQQYGNIVVRSIENAENNPSAIDKWIQSINDLHRSKPPPQVHYKKNMPDIETLMDVWPEAFEDALNHIPLPHPDLDLSLLEYTKVLCNVLDIPVYDNPIESLHVMFSLYMDFKNNPHFQALRMGEGKIPGDGKDYGNADVMKFGGDEDEYQYK